MIYFFTGKPGNGKSLHMAEIIYKELQNGKNVIANFPINEDKIKPLPWKHGKKGAFIYCPNDFLLNGSYLDSHTRKPVSGVSFLYLDALYNYAFNFHKCHDGRMIEHQTLFVIDECQELFNSRSWNRRDRLEWISFLREHRKFGFDVYLISQDDKVIDKQVRTILQDEYEHRLVNSYKFFGRLLGLLCGGKLFVCIQRTYMLGKKTKDSKLSAHYFRGRKKYYDIYDSYMTFHRARNPGAPAEG